MKLSNAGRRLGCVLLTAAGLGGFTEAARAQQKLHFTYLWHMEQPIYWPDKQTGQDRYERLSESLARGGAHPQNNLNDIFGLPDRVAGYQYRMRDCINAFGNSQGGAAPEAGAQISFSGGLIENIQSVAGTGYIGGQYGGGWYNSLREARGWSTLSGSLPRPGRPPPKGRRAP